MEPIVDLLTGPIYATKQKEWPLKCELCAGTKILATFSTPRGWFRPTVVKLAGREYHLRVRMWTYPFRFLMTNAENKSLTASMRTVNRAGTLRFADGTNYDVTQKLESGEWRVVGELGKAIILARPVIDRKRVDRINFELPPAAFLLPEYRDQLLLLLVFFTYLLFWS